MRSGIQVHLGTTFQGRRDDRRSPDQAARSRRRDRTLIRLQRSDRQHSWKAVFQGNHQLCRNRGRESQDSLRSSGAIHTRSFCLIRHWTQLARLIRGKGSITYSDLCLLIDYHYWAHDRVLDAVSALIPDQFVSSLGNSFSSDHDTIAHLCTAERIWITRLQGKQWQNIRRANAFLQCLLEKSRACLAIALLSVALPAIESIHLSDTE